MLLLKWEFSFQKLVEPQRRLVCYCRLNQIMDRTKRQAPNAHQREVFLFNDMMLVCQLPYSSLFRSFLNLYHFPKPLLYYLLLFEFSAEQVLLEKMNL